MQAMIKQVVGTTFVAPVAAVPVQTPKEDKLADIFNSLNSKPAENAFGSNNPFGDFRRPDESKPAQQKEYNLFD